MSRHGVRFFQTAEFLTTDFADKADKGRKITGYPRHPPYQRLNALAVLVISAFAAV